MHSVFTLLYSKCPIAIQNLGISIYGYFWKRKRFGGVFDLNKELFRSRNSYSKLEWNDYQTIELRKILIHAFDNVPFYTEKYKKHGFKRSDFEIFKLSDIQKLPFLEKEELRKYGSTSLLSKTRGKGEFHSSSGSTGTPTSIFYSPTFHQTWSAAFEVRIREWAGLNNKMKRGMIGGRRVVSTANSNGTLYRYNTAEKQVYFSAYHISNKTVANYLEGIIKYQVDYMTGYAMSNYFLASFIEKSELKAPKLSAVITSSEKLTPEMRATFRRVYGCETYDSYSGVEACGLISENEYGQLLFSPDTGVMEFLNDVGLECSLGEEGEIVSTGFLNYDQPLIRYRIGDKAKISLDQKNKCGRNMVVVDEIVGRVEDKIIGPDGREIVRFHSLFADIPSLVLAQIIQETLTDYTILIVVEDEFKKSSSDIIKSRFKSQLGDVTININKVLEIPKNKNGKFQAVISKLKNS